MTTEIRFDCPLCPEPAGRFIVTVQHDRALTRAEVLDLDADCDHEPAELTDTDALLDKVRDAIDNYDGAPLYSGGWGGDPRDAQSYVNAMRDAGRMR